MRFFDLFKRKNTSSSKEEEKKETIDKATKNESLHEEIHCGLNDIDAILDEHNHQMEKWFDVFSGMAERDNKKI